MTPIIGIMASQNYTRSVAVDYVVVGGGGGGAAGGSGAGGFLTSIGGSPLQLIPGTTYTVTVGAGGTGATNPYGTNAGRTKGNDSIFSSVTALGGGGGGAGGSEENVSSPVAALSGGSGGGGTYSSGTGAYGSGTSGQGFDGAGNNPSYVGSPYAGGGADNCCS